MLEAVRLGLGRRDLSRSNLLTALRLMPDPVRDAEIPLTSPKEIYNFTCMLLQVVLNRYLTADYYWKNKPLLKTLKNYI